MNGAIFFTLTIPTILAELWPVTILWSIGGIYMTLVFFNHRVTLGPDHLEVRNAFGHTHRVHFHDVFVFRKSRLRTLVIKGPGVTLRILDVFKDQKSIINHIFTRVDKHTVSDELLSEWNATWYLYKNQDN